MTNKMNQLIRECLRGDPNAGISSDEIEKKWSIAAIDARAEGVKWKQFQLRIENEFSSARTTEISVIDGEIKKVELDIGIYVERKKEREKSDSKEDIQKQIKFKKNSQSEFIFKTSRLLREVTEKIYANEDEIAKIKLKDSLHDKKPLISVAHFRMALVLYGLAGAYFNIPIFEEVLEGRPIGGFLAPIVGVIEALLAHAFGASLASAGFKSRQTKFLTFGSLALVAFMIVGQILFTDHGFIATAFILILYIVSVTFSWIYTRSGGYFRIKKLVKRNIKLKSKRDKLQDKLKVIDSDAQTQAERTVKNSKNNNDQMIESLKGRLTNLQSKKSRIESKADILKKKIEDSCETIFSLRKVS